MKLRIINYISAVCFFLSSASLLLIPLLDTENESKKLAYFVAGLFWIGLIAGTALQIFLKLKTSKQGIVKDLKKLRNIITVIFALSVVFGAFVLVILKNNEYALPINLLVTFLSAEMLCVIKKMERLL